MRLVFEEVLISFDKTVRIGFGCSYLVEQCFIVKLASFRLREF